MQAPLLFPGWQPYGAKPGGGGGDGGDGGGHVPRDPRDLRFDGPWLQQQLVLSITIGILSFLVFSLIRRRSPALFAPRTKLKGFMPHAKGIDNGVFSWVYPTLKAKEIKILHIVGLDAAVLLSFFKMGFWVFVFLSIWSCAILMPVNFRDHGSIDGVAPSEEPQPDDPEKGLYTLLPGPTPELPWTWRVSVPSLYHFTHLLSVYVFSVFIFRALYKGFGKFVRSRQLYALDLLQSIPARTVEVRNLPDHLRRERDLAEYFEGMGLAVESTVVVREVRGLKGVLAQRANALYALESAWCDWLGNPTTAGNYDPDTVAQVSHERAQILAEGGDRLVAAMTIEQQGGAEERVRLLADEHEIPDPAAKLQPPRNRPRPTKRLNAWNPFSKRVDAITLLEARFRALDLTVQKLRSRGAPPSTVGFVTFVDGMSAQIASQAVHYPLPAYCKTTLAPEPRDIIWSNVSIPSNERRVRQLLVSAFTVALFVFYIPPLAFLASLLSPQTIKKYLPSLYDLLKKDERLMALAGTSLPSIAVITFNAILPLILEWSAHLQGLKARSLVEFSVLKRYHLFLLTSVIFIFLITTTALGVIADLAGNPMRIIDKLAQSLPKARQFSLSYVIFQALAVIPLQLLQLPIIFGRAFGRLTARTPREHAELNAPPQLYAGSVYPAALIVFTLGVLYSIVMPLITVFSALYFALAYLVYKYKLLYVYYRSYESRGQAWPLCSTRIIWALCLFQFFQLSLFSFRKQFLLSTLMLPLIIFTIWFGLYLSRTFGRLSDHVSLSSIAEINKPSLSNEGDQGSALQAPDSALSPSPHIANTAAEGLSRPSKKRTENPILALRTAALNSLDPNETVLSRKRYAAKDETLFVAQSDRHTDYREPPAGGYYYGTLNTGRRRYGHPALTGILPDLWPPVRDEESEEKQDIEASGAQTNPSAQVNGSDGAQASNGTEGGIRPAVSSRLRRLSRPREAVVLSLRRRKSSLAPALGSQSATSIIRSPSTRVRKSSRADVSQQMSGRREGLPPTSEQSGKSSLAFPGSSSAKVAPSSAEDELCDLPGHQHENPSSVWGQPSADPRASRRLQESQQASSSSVAPGAPDQDNGTPALVATDNGDEVNNEGGGDNDEDNYDDDEDDEDDDDDDDDDDDEFAGVYVHRTARKGQFPGSFPGSSD